MTYKKKLKMKKRKDGESFWTSNQEICQAQLMKGEKESI